MSTPQKGIINTNSFNKLSASINGVKNALQSLADKLNNIPNE